jgi:two-component system CheB/CheR fusion protein
MMADDRDGDFEVLLDFLKHSRGFDFTAYKRATLYRRIATRMRMVGIESPEAYQRHLAETPEEYAMLFNTILINVTTFFRDVPAWESLRDEVIPRLLSLKGDDTPIRAWSAGCATGQEAYTLAIVLAETIGLGTYRERVKIYATDADAEALAQARRASYGEREIESVPPEYVAKYFERSGSRFVLRKELRRTVIFGCSDLVQDAPLSRLDLLVCRNTLMYFTPEAQAKVLARFHFALNDGGYLMLGRAETLFAHGTSFAPVDIKRRLFTKVPRRPSHER